MKRLSVITMIGVVIGAMVTVSCLSTGDAQTTTPDYFFHGLWEAVDPLDGSSIQISLSDNNADGTLEFVQGDSFWVACSEEGELGRGSVIGTATVNAEGNLDVVGTFTCTFTGRVLGENEEFVFQTNRQTDNLIAFPEGVPQGVAFHRVSTPRSAGTAQ